MNFPDQNAEFRPPRGCGKTHVPAESQRRIRDLLIESLSDAGAQDGEGSATRKNGAPTLIRTEGGGYPAVWTGVDGGGITLLCRGKTSTEEGPRWDLSMRDALYEEGKRALAGIGNGDLLFRLPLDPDVENLAELYAARVTDRENAADGDGGLEELAFGKAKGLLTRFLDEHPEVRHALAKREYAADAFVSDGRDAGYIPVFTRTREGIPAVWVGGGTLPSGKVKGVVACTEDLELRKKLKARKTGHLSLRQALLQLGSGDLVFYVEGPLPLERNNRSLNVKADQVLRPESAASSSSGGVSEMSKRKTREMFFLFLEKHPKIRHALGCRNGGDPDALGGSALEVKTGTVVNFNEEKGYGFIEPDSGDENFFAHVSEAPGEDVLAEGNRVEFLPTWPEKGPRALNIGPA